MAIARAAWAILAAMLVAPLPTPAVAGERLEVRIVPHFTSAPGSLRVTVSVEPDDRNRRLTVEVDSPALYRSSERPLNGDRAARTYAITFTHLPPGNYEIRVHLTGTGKELIAVRDFFVTSDKAS
ncbi:MAG: hypothetical protein HY655_10660 [Acidobacteria bacterium]|nr:hypothetical protein [Acidobacteriota bacterium]